MQDTIPKGDFDETTTEMGSLYVDHANQRIVHLDDYENYDDYRVVDYRLDDDGNLVKTEEFWDDEKLQAFINWEKTAYLSGHNFPGNGAYGVFVGPAPNCPDCGKFMSPGIPEGNSRLSHTIAAVGYTCKNYGFGPRRCENGYMHQADAIDKGLYLTIEDYLTDLAIDEKVAAKYGGR